MTAWHEKSAASDVSELFDKADQGEIMEKTKTFTFYLYFVEKFSSPDEPYFTLTDSEWMEAHGYTKVRPVEIEVELPDPGALVSQRLAALEQQKAELRAAFAKAVREVDGRIQSLLAIEMTETA